MNRRNFLGLSSALGGYLIGNRFVRAGEVDSKEDKACLFIYLHGGISHRDYTHISENASEPYRSVTGSVETTGGYKLGGSFKELAKYGNKLSVVQSFHHRDANHGSAASWIMEGNPHFNLVEGSPSPEPTYGSIVSNVFGSRNEIGIPTYTKVNKIEFGQGGRRDGAGWLGVQNIGFDADEEGITNLKLGIPKERVDQRMAMVEFLDKKESKLDKAWTQLRREAYNVAIGKASEAFDLTKESPENQNRFMLGKSNFGKSLLMARRLLERGSKYVTVANYGWDNHGDIAQKFNGKDGQELDWGLALIIDELEKISRLDNTLVVVASEFGRTKLNKDQGRDHWPSLVSLVFAGGGYNHGRLIGKSDSLGDVPAENPLTPQDLAWTIGDHFGMTKALSYVDSEKRPHHFFKEEAKNILL